MDECQGTFLCMYDNFTTEPTFYIVNESETPTCSMFHKPPKFFLCCLDLSDRSQPFSPMGGYSTPPYLPLRCLVWVCVGLNSFRSLVASHCLLSYVGFQFPTKHICSSLSSLRTTFEDRENNTEAESSCFSLLAFNTTLFGPQQWTFCSSFFSLL